MGLLDDLRAAAPSIDPSLAPSSNEVGPLLAALIAYQEHGDKFLKAAGSDDGPAKVSELLSDTGESKGSSSSKASKDG
jgi:hypothetical protein